MSTRLSASQRNTVLEDLSAIIGLRATVLLAAWWGGRNIVIPATRPETSVITKVIGVEATRRLSDAYGAEQIFIPNLNWFEEVRRAKQVHALRARGIPDAEIAQIMVMTRREVADMAEVGRFAAEAIALEKADRRGCYRRKCAAHGVDAKNDRVLYPPGNHRAAQHRVNEHA